jgi:predicted nucleic acid-binding protein
MRNIVISDTSCLILLHKIGELDLLRKVYDSVLTTPEVAQEFSDELPDWVKIEKVKDKKYQEFLETQVDWGEASAIALAKELESPLLLLDDLKARKLASKLNLRYTGTLGVIHKAKKTGAIEKVKPIIEKLLAADFWISENIIQELLRKNNETANPSSR